MEQIIAQREVCPSWIIADNRSSTRCFISDTVVCCGTLLHLGNCMTYNSTSDTIEHGPYPYIRHYNTINKNLCMAHVFYIQSPSNVSLLNEFMCGSLNQEGTLCGKCKDGYGTPLYTYTLECSKCLEHGYGWSCTTFWTFFPITVIHLLVVILHIRATSSPLRAIVLMSQTVVYTI